MSVLLIDIDHFKAYNDRCGHQAGDFCLRQVAGAVRRVALRQMLDIVARYGGEELIVVLFGADRTHAESATDAIVAAIAELGIAHEASATRPLVTVSIGVTALVPEGEQPPDLAVRLRRRPGCRP